MNNKLIKKILPIIVLTTGLHSKSFATDYTDCKKNQTNILLNGKNISLDAYNIKGNNYFKLRDLSSILNGTKKQFNVIWDENLKSINLESNKPYLVKGMETKKIEKEAKQGIISNNKIYKDRNEILLDGYVINGSTYYKLRDLADELEMDLNWNEELKTIELKTEEMYIDQFAKTQEYILDEEEVIDLKSVDKVELEVIEIVNLERSKLGLKALKVNNKLMDLSREKSRDMSVGNYFSHNSPSLGSPFDMMNRANVNYMSAGENIAMGQVNAEMVMDAWMNSPGHRQNILKANFTEIGVGLYKSEKGSIYWTQMFIGN